jgi:hypothetical protein
MDDNKKLMVVTMRHSRCAMSDREVNDDGDLLPHACNNDHHEVPFGVRVALVPLFPSYRPARLLFIGMTSAPLRSLSR